MTAAGADTNDPQRIGVVCLHDGRLLFSLTSPALNFGSIKPIPPSSSELVFHPCSSNFMIPSFVRVRARLFITPITLVKEMVRNNDVFDPRKPC